MSQYKFTTKADLDGMTQAQKDKRILDLERALVDVHAKVITITECRTSHRLHFRAHSFVRSMIRRIRCEFGSVAYLKGDNKRKGLRK